MSEYGQNYQLVAVHLTGPPIQEMFTLLGPNPTGVAYEVNPSDSNCCMVNILKFRKMRILINICNFSKMYVGHLN